MYCFFISVISKIRRRNQNTRLKDITFGLITVKPMVQKLKIHSGSEKGFRQSY